MYMASECAFDLMKAQSDGLRPPWTRSLFTFLIHLPQFPTLISNVVVQIDSLVFSFTHRRSPSEIIWPFLKSLVPHSSHSLELSDLLSELSSLGSKCPSRFSVMACWIYLLTISTYRDSCLCSCLRVSFSYFLFADSVSGWVSAGLQGLALWNSICLLPQCLSLSDYGSLNSLTFATDQWLL